jgi:hypothetical protein
MKSIAKVFLFVSLLVVGISCTQDTIVDPRLTVVPATLDLAVGFNNQDVRIYVNDKICYAGVLGSVGVLSGPIAQCQGSVAYGSNTIVVETRPASTRSEYTRQSATVTVGGASQYYLSLILNGGALMINIQDTPFYYL